MWDICRTKPGGSHRGKCIPAFIDNMQMHYAAIEVYEDGVVDAWGFVDLKLFDKQLKSGWVNVNPPLSSRISIFNLGLVTVKACDWNLRTGDVRRLVRRIVKELNPEEKFLVNMRGKSTRLVDGVNQPKMGFSDACPVLVESGTSEVRRGASIPVFENKAGDFRLQHWFIFENGLARIGYNGDLVPFEDSCQMVESRNLTTVASDGSWIIVPGLGKFLSSDGAWGVSPEQRVLEARDVLAALQGGPDSIQKCIKAFENYLQQSNEANKLALRDAYESVPEHLKMYCGDMDTKDIEIREILYPGNSRQ